MKLISIDTNLILLLVVGLTDVKYIGMHKNLKEYSIDDFDILKCIIEKSNGIVVTPQVLAETSNLLAYISDPAKKKIFLAFRAIIESTVEIMISSKIASRRNEFLYLGLTDSVLLELGSQNYSILTTDSRLCYEAQNAGIATINFNHLRNL